MSAFLKKVGSFIIFGIASVFNGLLLAGTVVGLTTTPDDLANLPRFAQCMLGTPWWVPALIIPTSLILFAIWVFGDDRSIQRAMAEYRSSNERAWKFEPTFLARCEELDRQHQATSEQNRNIAEQIGDLKAAVEGLRQNVSNEILSKLTETAVQESRRVSFGVQQGFTDQVRQEASKLKSIYDQRLLVIEKI